MPVCRLVDPINGTSSWGGGGGSNEVVRWDTRMSASALMSSWYSYTRILGHCWGMCHYKLFVSISKNVALIFEQKLYDKTVTISDLSQYPIISDIQCICTCPQFVIKAVCWCTLCSQVNYLFVRRCSGEVTVNKYIAFCPQLLKPQKELSWKWGGGATVAPARGATTLGLRWSARGPSLSPSTAASPPSSPSPSSLSWAAPQSSSSPRGSRRQSSPGFDIILLQGSPLTVTPVTVTQ